jgi:hypothetical protein
LAGDVTAAAEASEVGTVSFATMPYATFFSEQATIVPEGVVAYTAAWSDKQTFLNLNEVKGYIPAETAVILKDTTNAASATLQSTIYTVAAVDGNVLIGAKEDLATPTDHDVYTLSVANDVVAFRKYTGTKLSAGKAYLELPTSAAIPMIRIAGDDTDEPGNVSGINAVTIEDRAADVIYDLRGRRVQSLDRSGLYIVNGKKVVVK